MEHLLEVKNLSVSIDGPVGEVQAVRDVSFSLKKGEVLAIVGESGCGKSVLCKSIMKLLPPSAKIKEGSICVNGQDITCYREKEMQKLRGRVFSMIFQDPMTSLNPTIKIGKQIGEAVVIHNKNYTKEQVNKKGWILNRIPGVKWLRLREVISFSGFYGGLTDKNNPALDPTGLYRFPEGTSPMGRTPYLEASVGLENIFKILRIDYYRRLTYLDQPNIKKGGVRIALRFSF